MIATSSLALEEVPSCCDVLSYEREFSASGVPLFGLFGFALVGGGDEDILPGVLLGLG